MRHPHEKNIQNLDHISHFVQKLTQMGHRLKHLEGKHSWEHFL